jgi:soluble lytic murein transglycosylase-like protein
MMTTVKRFALLLAAVVAPAQTQPPDPYEAVQAAMQASLAKQKESAHKQAKVSDTAESSSFFTVPWPRPAPLAPIDMADNPACRPLSKAFIGPYLEEAAAREGLAPDLLNAAVDKESGYRPCAVPDQGATDLMQLTPSTAAPLGVRDPFAPPANGDAGARMLKRLVDRYGENLMRTLGAYNSAGGVPTIPGTINYVSDILDKLQVR